MKMQQEESSIISTSTQDQQRHQNEHFEQQVSDESTMHYQHLQSSDLMKLDTDEVSSSASTPVICSPTETETFDIQQEHFPHDHPSNLPSTEDDRSSNHDTLPTSTALSPSSVKSLSDSSVLTPQQVNHSDESPIPQNPPSITKTISEPLPSKSGNLEVPSSLDSNESKSAATAQASLVHLFLFEHSFVSFLTFICGLIFFYLVSFQNYTVLTLISYLVMFQLCICFLFINGTKLFLSFKGIPITQHSSATSSLSFTPGSALIPTTSPHVHIEYVFISQNAVIEYSGLITDFINSFLNMALRILRCQNNVLTIFTIAFCLISGVIGRLINSVNLGALIWIGCFILPKLLVDHGDKLQLYASRFSSIDHWADRIQNKVNEALSGLSGKQKKQ